MGFWIARHRICQMGFVMVACSLAGCGKAGPPMGSVSGTVTFNGSPVTEGTISLIETTKGTAGASTLDKTGTFKIVSEKGGLPPGTYKVVVEPPLIPGQTDGTTPPAMVPKAMPNIPEKYRLGSSTDLQVTVKAGSNQLPIDLK